MRRLLLALYPASWRTRYGEEFELVLRDRPLGPFDVADILLGALDAHLHLRGLGAASQHGKGLAMSLRIGGWAAVLGGTLWLAGMVGAFALSESNDNAVWAIAILAGTASLLLALVGLSAFQARREPVLVWAAFAVPAIGACVSIIGLVGMAVVGDRRFLGEYSAWYVWAFGMLALFVGSSLFAIATWRTRTLSRAAAAILGVSSLIVLPVVSGMSGGIVPELVGTVLTFVSFLAFAGGWLGLGVSALRTGRPMPTSFEGAIP